MLDSLTGIRLILKMGKSRPQPVPYEVITALTSVQVIDNAKSRDGFQLSFSLGKRQIKDYSLLQSGLFDPQTKVSIVLQVQGRNLEPLMSGVIQNIQIQSSNEPGQSALTVMGEGIDGLLGLEEKNKKYDRQADSTIAKQISSQYAKHGIVIDVPKTTEQPNDNRLIPRQYATDLEYLEQTAARNGYVFYTDPLPDGRMRFYWGPEERKDVQPALTMNMGAATNVLSLSFTFDSKKPVDAKGTTIAEGSTNDQTVSPASSYGIKNLSRTPAQAERTILLRDVSKYSTSRAQLRSKELMIAKFGAVSGRGEVDTIQYGHILKAGQTVGVRGAGDLYNGEYYVDKVTHKIERGKYTQEFELSREGTGAKSKKVRRT